MYGEILEIGKNSAERKLDPRRQKLLAISSGLLATALLNPESLKGQMVNTADSLGKGNSITTFSSSYISAPDFWQKYHFLAESIGINKQTDLIAGVGVTTLKTAEGEKANTQHNLFGGAKYNLYDKAPLPKISLLGILSTPLDKRREGSLTLYSALIASKNLKGKKIDITPYAGFTSLIPLSNPEGKRFAPPSPQQSISAGVYKPVNPQVALYAEFNLGVGQNKGKIFTLGLDFPGPQTIKKLPKIFKSDKRP